MSASPSNLSNIPFQKDIMYFKEDVLTSIKELTSKLNTKFTEASDQLNSQLTSYDTKFDILSQKISDLSYLITKDKTLTDKISALLEFKASTETTLTSLQIRESIHTKQITDAVFKYDKVIIDNLLLPGIIGNNCKFKTFREFADFLLNQMNQFNTFKDKQIIDLDSYKSKLESLTKSLTSQINTLNTTVTMQTNQSINDCEERIKDLLTIYDHRLEDMRIENSKLVMDLKSQYNSLMQEWKKVLGIKQEIFKRFDNEVEKIVEGNKNLLNRFDGYKKEFKLIKNRFTQLSEFIKDVRFRINAGGLKKKETFQISSVINFSKKQVYKEESTDNTFRLMNNNNSNSGQKDNAATESVLKKYITGEVDLDTYLEPRRSRKAHQQQMSGFQRNTPKDDNDDKNNNNELSELSKSNVNNMSAFSVNASNVIAKVKSNNKSNINIDNVKNKEKNTSREENTNRNGSNDVVDINVNVNDNVNDNINECESGNEQQQQHIRNYSNHKELIHSYKTNEIKSISKDSHTSNYLTDKLHLKHRQSQLNHKQTHIKQPQDQIQQYQVQQYNHIQKKISKPLKEPSNKDSSLNITINNKINNNDNTIDNSNQHINTHPRNKTRNQIQLNKHQSDHSINNNPIKLNPNLSAGNINPITDQLPLTLCTNMKPKLKDNITNPKIRITANTNRTIHKQPNSDTLIKQQQHHQQIQRKRAQSCHSQEPIIPSHKFIEFPATNIDQILMDKSLNQKQQPKKLKEYINKLKEETSNENYMFHRNSSDMLYKPYGYQQGISFPINVTKALMMKHKQNNTKGKYGFRHSKSMSQTQYLPFNRDVYSNEMLDNFYYNVLGNEDVGCKNEQFNEINNNNDGNI